jgi:hypothetical protein
MNPAMLGLVPIPRVVTRRAWYAAVGAGLAMTFTTPPSAVAMKPALVFFGIDRIVDGSS